MFSEEFVEHCLNHCFHTLDCHYQQKDVKEFDTGKSDS